MIHKINNKGTRMNLKQLINDNYATIKLNNGLDINIKMEGYNPAGSIKLKTAFSLVEYFENKKLISSNTIFIESSSGNLGVALSAVCAERNYKFTCVSDPNTSKSKIETMQALGAKVVVVDKVDGNGGYLESRINYIKEKVSNNKNYIWFNQYANQANPDVHRNVTAREIFEKYGSIDYLVIGAGTTGTLMGCTEYCKLYSPLTKIYAVDARGSVTFGGLSGVRKIPGLGTSRRPEICDEQNLDEIIYVDEIDTIEMCRWVSKKYGLFIGDSTGTVLAAIENNKYLFEPGKVIVTISPDTGNGYIDTIYNDEWCSKYFPSIEIQKPNEITLEEA